MVGLEELLKDELAETLAKFGPLPVAECQRFGAYFRHHGVDDYADALARHLGRRALAGRAAKGGAAPSRAPVAAKPDHVKNAVMVGLRKDRRGPEAVRLARTLLAEGAGGNALLNFLAVTVLELGHALLAERLLRPLVERMPGNPYVLTNLAHAMNRQRRYVEAEEFARAALAHKPDHVPALVELGGAIADRGDKAGSIPLFRQALERDPGNRAALSALLFHQANEAEVLPEEQRRLAERFRAAIPPQAMPPRPPLRSGAGPLRAGFMSGDFGFHPVGYFIAGFIGHLRGQGIDPVLFATIVRKDSINDRIRAGAAEYHNVATLGEEELLRLVKGADLDILFDLSGHTAGARLGVFAARPAPVQATYLGYYGTTGLPEIDFIVGDDIVTPFSNAGHFVERIHHVDGGYVTFLPETEGVRPAGSPCAENGYVTFACFGRAEKAGPAVIDAWVEILRRVPDSRLLLKNSKWETANSRQLLFARMAEQGIESSRVAFEGNTARRAYFEAYNRVDIILDTFPYMGATTSAEALAMGVPVIALRGGHMASSLGAAVLAGAGFGELVATHVGDYVATAMRVAGLVRSGEWTKAAVRARADASGFFDGATFAPRFARAIREMIGIVRAGGTS
jgi:predicted O-linked N-acetylglucosamine transferase (SPINDLY family)